ncbi:MAG: hypothetical protein ABIO72_01170 [Patescibacteria group bacterium]
MPTKPIQDKIFQINADESARYVNEEAARVRYWAKHTTFIGCIKCMDGRVLFPSITKTPFGIVKAFRAIGGKFNVWWPSFLGRVRHWVDVAASRGSRNALFVTYHFSASDVHLGCAGWGYDTKMARAHAEQLQKDLSYVFGEQLTAIVTGIETDRDTLILHGPNGDLSGADLVGKTEEDGLAALVRVFPKMDLGMAKDIIPFMMGNAERVKELADRPRELHEMGHNERIIAIGQGFDWLAEANLALIINDADPNLAESIRVAASLIERNLAGVAEDDHATIFTSIPYRQPGEDYRQAVARSLGLKAFAESVIRSTAPALSESGRLESIASVMWEPNKKIERIDEARATG